MSEIQQDSGQTQAVDTPASPTAATPPATPDKQQAAAQPDKPKSLRETIRAAVKQAPQKDPATGKFVPAAASGEPSSPATPKAAPSPERAGEAQQPATNMPGVKAPDSWNKDMKAKFNELPDWAQAYVNQRESEVTKKLTSQDDERSLGRRVKEMAQPYAHLIAMENASVDAAFGDYLRTAAILRQGTPQQKIMALQKIAQQFNVPLGVPPQHGPQLPPELMRLQQEWDGFKQQQQTEAQQRQLREQAALNDEISAFSAQGHEHFDAVRDTMAALLMNGKAETLQEAYDQAIWAHPDIRSTLIQAQTAQAEQASRAKAQQQVDASRQAAVSVTGGPGSLQPQAQKPSGSLRDQIRANLRAANGGQRIG